MSNPTVNNTCNAISWADSSGYIDSIGVTVGGGPYNLFPICHSNLVCSNNPPNDGGYGSILIGTQTFAFSQPITDPVLAIFSLGNSFGTSPQGACSTTPLLICNDVTGDACSASTTSSPIAIFGNTITGAEGFGLVMFPGTHNSISIVWDIAENTRIRWGVCSSAVPPPPPPPPPPQSTPPPRIPGSINIKCCKVIPSSTPTTTPTLTPTNTATTTLTPTITPTSSVTPTNTPTSTVTPTNTPSTTVTATITPTISVTVTSTPTVTATNTATPTITQTTTLTPTITQTQTATQTQTPANTVTPAESRTPTPTQTVTITTTPTLTNTSTPTSSVTTTPTISPSQTVTPTVTPSPPLLIKPTDYLILLIDESNSWQTYPSSTAYVNWPYLAPGSVRMNWEGYNRYGTGTVWADGSLTDGTNLDYSTTLWESHYNDVMSISSTLDFNKMIVFHTPCRRVATATTYKCVAEPIFPSKPRSGQTSYPKCPIPPKNFKWANRPNRLCSIVPDNIFLSADYIYKYVIDPAFTLLDASPAPGSTIRIFIDNSPSATQDPGGASFISIVNTFISNNSGTYNIVKYTCENEQWLRWIYNAALGSTAICT